MDSRLNDYRNKLLTLTANQLISRRAHLNTLIQRLIISSPEKIIPGFTSKINYLEQRLKTITHQKIKECHLKLATQASSLHSVSPLATLGRGFSILSQNKEVITSISQLDIESSLEARLLDGTIECSINTITPITET